MSRPEHRSRRPLLRLRNVLLLCVGLVVAWIGLEVYRALTAAPGRAVDYGAHVAELTERYQPPGAGPGMPNAWDALLEAIRLADEVDAAYRQPVLPEEGERGAITDFTLVYSPTNDDRGFEPHTAATVRAKALLALEAMEEVGVFEAMAEAARRRRAVRPRPEGRLITILLPELGRSRHLARASAARMFVAAERGEFGKVAETFESMLGMGRVLTHQFTLIDHLVGIAIDALAAAEARRLMVEHRFDEPSLRAMLAALDRQPLAPFALALEGERIGLLDIIQWTHTDDGRGSGRLILSEAQSLGVGFTGAPTMFKGSRLINLGGLLFASKAATTRKLNEIMDAIARRSQLPRAQRALAGPDPGVMMEELSRRYILLRIMLPAWGQALTGRDQIDVELVGTRVMLAIEIFRVRKGRPPATLAELAPSVLPKVPQDPRNQAPFGYRAFGPGEDVHGRAYLLYSRGLDGLDDGGKRHPKDNHLARRPDGAGYDFILNEPREAPEPVESEPGDAGPEEEAAEQPAVAPEEPQEAEPSEPPAAAEGEGV